MSSYYEPICHVQSSAFATVPSDRDCQLPADFVGDFAAPTRHQDCCAVMRRSNGVTTPPRRCKGRRREYGKDGSLPATKLTCAAHRMLEAKARGWRMELDALERAVNAPMCPHEGE